MFKRRVPKSKWQNFKEYFWPSMGFWRTGKYMLYRIVRLSDSSHNIALGLAFGISVSFTPFVGIQFVQAGILTYLFRGNVLAALIGTFVGNPWTWPFFWILSLQLGAAVFNFFGVNAQAAVPHITNLEQVWEIAKTEPMQVFLPFLTGGYLMMAILWPICYIACFQAVKAAKHWRHEAKMKNLRKNEAK